MGNRTPSYQRHAGLRTGVVEVADPLIAAFVTEATPQSARVTNRGKRDLFVLKSSTLKHLHSLLAEEAVVITKINQGLVVELEAAEAVSHRKALKTHVQGLLLVTYHSSHQCVNRWKSHLEFDFGRSIKHAEAEGRHVDAPVTFPEDEEVVPCEIGELGEKAEQGLVIIVGNLGEGRVNSWAVSKL